MKQLQSAFKLKFTISIYMFWAVVFFLFNATDFASTQGFLPGILLLAGFVLNGLYFIVIFFTAEADSSQTETASHSPKFGFARVTALLLPFFVILAIDTPKLVVSHQSAAPDPVPNTSQSQNQNIDSTQQIEHTSSEKSVTLDVTLLDIHRGLDSYAGKRINTIGMIKFDAPETPEGASVLFRFVMVCCANDMQPVAVLVRGDVPEGTENESWVKITGLVSPFEIEGQTAIAIQAEEIKTVSQPDPPFINMTF